MSGDKVTITVTLERMLNGNINIERKVDGAGFHYFEIVGLLEMAKQSFVEDSHKAAEDINAVNKDRPTRLEFKSEQTNQQ
jgi:hypothetical protein